MVDNDYSLWESWRNVYVQPLFVSVIALTVWQGEGEGKAPNEFYTNLTFSFQEVGTSQRLRRGKKFCYLYVDTARVVGCSPKLCNKIDEVHLIVCKSVFFHNSKMMKTHISRNIITSGKKSP